MRVLVTGGAGFIGSHVVDALVDDGHEVRVLDVLLAAAHSGPPQWRNPAADYIWGDLTDVATAAKAVAGVDAVSHQSAMVGLGVDFDDAAEYVHNNDRGTAVLLRALHRARFRGRLALASSMVVYGEGRYTCLEHGDVTVGPRRADDLDAGGYEPRCPYCRAPLVASAVPETVPADPRNVYAATKLHQEHLCRSFAREHPGVSATALRYHNVYGPRMPRDTPYAGVASIFRSALAAGRAPRVMEDGRQTRDFVHVTDIARANVLALTGPPPADGFTAVNVCSGEPHTVGDFADVLTAAMHGPAPMIVGGARPADVRHVVASPDLAASTLGFRARIRFADGVAAFATDAQRASVGPVATNA
jgi:dTDP-L-rhamnose 4-epimerase